MKSKCQAYRESQIAADAMPASPALTPALQRHGQTCQACRLWQQHYEQTRLALAPTPARAPAGLKQRILDHVEPLSNRPCFPIPFPKLLPIGALALLCLAGVSWFWATQTEQHLLRKEVLASYATHFTEVVYQPMHPVTELNYSSYGIPENWAKHLLDEEVYNVY